MVSEQQDSLIVPSMKGSFEMVYFTEKASSGEVMAFYMRESFVTAFSMVKARLLIATQPYMRVNSETA
jgi:hypothetical protein